MRLSAEAIKEFKDIYYQELRQRISDEEAQEVGGALISLFKIIYRPIPEAGEQYPRNKNNNRLEPI